MLIDLRVKHDVGAWGHPVVPFDSDMGCWVVSCANSLRILIARTRHETLYPEGVLVLDLAMWLLGEQVF